jgi:hypothetical protein
MRGAFEEERPEARVNRESRELAGTGEGVESFEEGLGGLEGRFGGRFVPRDTGGFVAHGVEVEEEGGEFAAADLGDFGFRAAREVLDGVQTDDAARGGASGASGALGGVGFGDAGDLERGESRVRVIARLTDESGVDDGGDAFDGERRFGDVCREDDLGTRAGVDRAVLLFGRKVAVEGEHVDGLALGERFEGALGAADFGGSGEEDEEVAGVWGREKAFGGGGDLIF